MISFCFADQANFRFFIQLDGKRCHTWVDRPWSEAFLASGAMSAHTGSYPKFCLNLVIFVASLAISGEEDPTADSNHRCQMYFGQTKIWLVVWNMAFIFPHVGNSNPNWLSYFAEGLKPPICIYIYKWRYSMLLGLYEGITYLHLFTKWEAPPSSGTCGNPGTGMEQSPCFICQCSVLCCSIFSATYCFEIQVCFTVSAVPLCVDACL